MKLIQFIGVVVFCISTDVGANDAWNNDWIWGGEQWDAISTKQKQFQNIKFQHQYSETLAGNME